MAPRVLVDRRRDVASMFLLSTACAVWFALRQGWPTPTWFLIVSTVLSIAACVGVLRASEWGRWLAGSLAALEAANGVGLLAYSWTERPAGTSWTTARIVLLVFALLWAAIAIYLLRPSTRRLFAHVRAARVRTA